MAQNSEQEGKPLTEEDVVILIPYGGFYCVALTFASYGERAGEARAAYDAYAGSLLDNDNEGGSERRSAEFARITRLSAERIFEISRRKQGELEAQFIARG
jgi:hypothetical protein